MPYPIRMPKTHHALWFLQFALAAAFALQGMFSLYPAKEFQGALTPLSLPPAFLNLIIGLEFLGAAGLILPAVTRIAPILTPLAAAGLTLLMLGATSYQLWSGDVEEAIVPAILALFSAFVAEGRTRFVRIPPRACPSRLQTS